MIFFVDVEKKDIKNILKIPKLFKLKGTQKEIRVKATDLHDSLAKNAYVNSECKKDFIKIFTGLEPKNKIVWYGLKGELKSFINLLIEYDKIEDCKSIKWIITAANFKFQKEDFISNTIKDTKKAKNEIRLRAITSKI